MGGIYKDKRKRRWCGGGGGSREMRRGGGGTERVRGTEAEEKQEGGQVKGVGKDGTGGGQKEGRGGSKRGVR